MRQRGAAHQAKRPLHFLLSEVPKVKQALKHPGEFSRAVVAWQKEFGRQDLPWQVKDAYCRWVSEIMLQQTQVVTVLGYYERFMKAFPTVQDLAAASEDDVMRLWAGLGYYSRVRNLHSCAKIVCEMGGFPKTPEALAELPGIGNSTAAAIASSAFDAVAPVLDGNVKRVLTRVLAEAAPVETATAQRILQKAAQTLLSKLAPAVYNQGLMDLGSLVCTRSNPQCGVCPVAAFCKAHASGRETDFPVKKKRTARPERETDMTVYCDDEGVWLQKRAGAGVWKGLWSLPEVREGSESLGGFVHDFSHYRLVAHVWRVREDAPVTMRDEVRMAKFPWRAVASEAVPTPVKKFLLQLASEDCDA